MPVGCGQYFVVINGKPSGPYSLDDLKDLEVAPDTFIKGSDMDDFKEAHEIPEIGKLFGFRFYTAVPQYYASLDMRLLASGIDYFLLILIYTSLVLVGFTFSDQALLLKFSLPSILLIPLVKFIYSVWMESSYWQATLGKSWLGLKVCNEYGERISVRTAIIRNLSKGLSTLTLGIGYLAGFFNRRQQCLHDKIAGTIVVKDRLI